MEKLTGRQNNLQLARMLKGYTQKEVAELIGVSTANYSKIESGISGLKLDLKDKFVEALKLPESFFDDNIQIFSSLGVYYRKRPVISRAIADKIEAIESLLYHSIRKLAQQVEIDVLLEPMSLIDYETPERVAQALRFQWQIPSGPIHNLVELIESKGVIVLFVDFNSDKFDGSSFIIDRKYPVIFVNKNSSPDRQRLTIAHELGHLIMHFSAGSHENAEKEAFRFGIEFLAPITQVKVYCNKVTFGKLFELKLHFGVSIQSLVRHLKTNKILTESQERYFYIEISRKGYRKEEPGSEQIHRENSKLFFDIVNVIKEELNYNKDEFTKLTNFTFEEILNWVSPETERPKLSLLNL